MVPEIQTWKIVIKSVSQNIERHNGLHLMVYIHLTLHLYFKICMLLFIVKSSLQCATEIINLIDNGSRN